MGCDIHIYSESLKNGIWVPNEDIRKDPYREGEDYVGTTYDESWYQGRCYILFDTLAGVRGGGFYQRFDVKGIPDNISPEVNSAYKYWGVDGHTPSYITISELREYLDTDFRIDIDKLRCTINEWIDDIETASENSIDSFELNDYLLTLSNKMEEYLNGSGLDEDELYVYETLQQWENKLSDFTGDDHRLVFWFDS